MLGIVVKSVRGLERNFHWLMMFLMVPRENNSKKSLKTY